MGAVDGKVVLITGAARGIGRGMARRFAREGARVFMADIDEANGSEVAQGLAQLGPAGTFIRTDVTQRGQVYAFIAAAVEATGRVDVLINNAYTLSPNVPIHEKTDEMLDFVLKGGLWATWWGMQAAFPHMRRQGGGRIINFYSGDAESGAWFRADYVASKSAIHGITRNAAHEWARFNITCNLICPAAAGTQFVTNAAKNPAHVDAFRGRNPMGRMGDPEEDTAPVAVFLASDAARYVTGEMIHVDGGQHMPRRQSKPADVEQFERDWQAGKRDF